MIGLAWCGLTLLIVAQQIVPASAKLMALVNEHPAMLSDARTYTVAALLGLWGLLGTLCAVLAQAFNKRVVDAVLE